MNLSDKLDASPRIVSDWRVLWRAWSVRVSAFGAALHLGIGAAIWISPLLGIVWVSWPVGAAMVGTGILFALAVVARYLAQPDIPGATQARPPLDDTDKMGDAGELPK